MPNSQDQPKLLHQDHGSHHHGRWQQGDRDPLQMARLDLVLGTTFPATGKRDGHHSHWQAQDQDLQQVWCRGAPPRTKEAKELAKEAPFNHWSKDITNRNARRELKKTNHVSPKDDHTGPKSISWRKIRLPNPSMQSITQGWPSGWQWRQFWYILC